MHAVSLEHVQLTNRLRVYKREVFLAAAEELRRLKAEGDIDLDQAGAFLIGWAVAQAATRQREINHERLVEYLVNGMSLDCSGLPTRMGQASAGDQAFERLSAQIDAASGRHPWTDEDIPRSSLAAGWMAAQRSVYRFKAWAVTHPTCVLN